jgi:Subtilase family
MPVSGMCRKWVLLISWLAIGGCFSEKSLETPDRSDAAGRQAGPSSESGAATGENILLVDEGFDRSHPWIEGKEIASFSISCEEDSQSSFLTATDFQQAKKEYLRYLATDSSPCSIVQGIPIQASWTRVSSVDQKEWNQSVMLGQVALADPKYSRLMFSIAQGVSPDGRMIPGHGVATSSLASYGLKSPRLVTIEIHFKSPDGPVECPNIGQLTILAQLNEDRDVRAAMIKKPKTAFQKEIETITEKYRIGIINESFGAPPLQVLVQQFKDSGCLFDANKFVELHRRIAASEEAVALKRETSRFENILTIKAAGNDGFTINSSRDAFDCADRSKQIMIGSYGKAEIISQFSQRGDCVDFYAPGEDIVQAGLAGLLTSWSGTSFSAPLVTNLVVSHLKPPYTRDAVAGFLKGLSKAGTIIGQENFPKELLFKPLDIPKVNSGAQGMSLLSKNSTLKEILRKQKLQKLFWGR